MDNYIYYKILGLILNSEIISRTEIVQRLSLHSYKRTPIDYLLDRGFIELVPNDPKDTRTRYYKITNEGMLLYKKMSIFYDFNNKLLKRLHVRLKIGEKVNDQVLILSS